jgi:hypothetical protein
MMGMGTSIGLVLLNLLAQDQIGQKAWLRET